MATWRLARCGAQVEVEKIYLRDPSYFAANNIDLLLGRVRATPWTSCAGDCAALLGPRLVLRLRSLPQTVESVNPAGKNLKLDDGSTVPYTKLLLATGTEGGVGRPGGNVTHIARTVFHHPLLSIRRHAAQLLAVLQGPAQRRRHPLHGGRDGPGEGCVRWTSRVCPVLLLAHRAEQSPLLLLSVHACGTAIEAKPSPRIIVVGSSFIGMEAASTLVKVASSLVVIGMEKVPFERVLGAQIGTAMQKLHEEKGVKFRMGAVVDEFIANGALSVQRYQVHKAAC